LKRIVRKVAPVKVPHPEWRELLSSDYNTWNHVRTGAEDSPRVLLATSVGGHVGVTTWDSLLAIALTLRGAKVDVLLCDEVLPACEQCMVFKFLGTPDFVRHGPKRDICPACFSQAEAMFKSLGIRVHRYSHFLQEEDRRRAEDTARSLPVDQIASYAPGGVPVGEHAFAGALRFYARGTLTEEPEGEAVLRRYFRAALLTQAAVSRLLDEQDYVCASFHHGIYIPQGIVGAVARSRGVRVVNWMPAYRKKTFIFSHDDTYHHTLMTEPVSQWEAMDWTPEREAELMDYLRSRWDGSRDWISFNRAPENDLKEIERELGIDFSRPCVGLLTNVIWDAQLHYPTNVFPNMIEWMVETIRYFAGRPDLQLIIRVHPAEVKGAIPSRQAAVEEIRRAFPELPPNVFIIPPTSPISTYVAMLQCNAVVIYGTKTGVELTSMGIPVIVAGEAWIKNKGITTDPRSVREYFEILDRLPLEGRLSEEVTRRARKYAYHFFFRRMIPTEVVTPAEGNPPYRIRIDGLDALRPGRDAGLDIICEGIMTGSPFVYPAELEGKPAEPAMAAAAL
jgi:hypothetical protein